MRATSPFSPRFQRHAVSVAVAVACLLLAWRLLAFIAKGSVNVLFWDQWDFYDALFHPRGAWELFRWQHGPPRLGIGLILTRLVAEASGWDTSVEALVIGAVTVLNAVLALLLKVRLTGTLEAWDVLVPVMFLSLRQAEMFLVTPNIAHSALPLLLVLLFGLALSVRGVYARCGAMLVINFLAIYTGFGLFLGLITPLVFAADLISRPSESTVRGGFLGLCLGISLASLGSFFVGYQFLPAADCFQFPHPRIREYLVFSTLMLGRPFVGPGYRLEPLVVGAAVLAGLLTVGWAAVRGARRDGHERYRWLVLGVFSGFTLLFVAGTTVGRVCLGVTAGQASRYMPYLLPGVFALYVASRTLAPRWWRVILTGVLAILLVRGEWKDKPFEQHLLRVYAEGKARWAQCYRERRDIGACDAASGFRIYPHPEATHLRWKLDFLEKRRLNLFKAEPP